MPESILLMGNECITQAHDVRAALANYEQKRLSYYPEYIDAWIRKGITLFNEKRVLRCRELP